MRISPSMRRVPAGRYARDSLELLGVQRLTQPTALDLWVREVVEIRDFTTPGRNVDKSRSADLQDFRRRHPTSSVAGDLWVMSPAFRGHLRHSRCSQAM